MSIHIRDLTEGEFLVYQAMVARGHRYHWMQMARLRKEQGHPYLHCAQFAKSSHKEFLRYCSRLEAEHARA